MSKTRCLMSIITVKRIPGSAKDLNTLILRYRKKQNRQLYTFIAVIILLFILSLFFIPSSGGMYTVYIPIAVR